MQNRNAMQTAKAIRVAHTAETWKITNESVSNPFRDEENPTVVGNG
jgi:hypothetical protein